MGRIRNIKPEMFTDYDLGALRPIERWFFAGLFTQADKEGRQKDKPKELKVAVIPYDDEDPESILKRLHPKFIMRYAAQGNPYIQIINFTKHQYRRESERESEIPPIPEWEIEKVRKKMSKNGKILFKGEGKGRGGRGRGGARSASADLAASPTVFVFPTAGHPKEW